MHFCIKKIIHIGCIFLIGSTFCNMLKVPEDIYNLATDRMLTFQTMQ